MAASTTDFLKDFSVKVFDLAGLVIRTDKTKALPLGFNTEISQVVTEAEILSAAKRFTVKCDQCGRLMANEMSLRSHKALQCPRILNSGGKVYEVHSVVDDTTCDSGVWLRVKWKGYDTHTWEPEWELKGHENRVGTAVKAVSDYWDRKLLPTFTAPPKGGDCTPTCNGSTFQCRYCCWWTDFPAALKSHQTLKPDAGGCKGKPKKRGGSSVSARVLKKQRKIGLLARLPEVQGVKRKADAWIPESAETVGDFVYLGSKVQGTTGSLSEIEHRIEKGNHAIRKHYAFWKGDKISKAHKIQAYRMYVTSVVMHGFEGWHLSDKAQAMINGFDIRF